MRWKKPAKSSKIENMTTSLIGKIREFFVAWLTKEIEPLRELPLTDFERIQYELRPCDVLLIEGRTRVSRVIQMITQSSWSHSALYIGRLHDISNRALRERIQQFYQGEPDEQLIIESMLGEGIIVSPLAKYQHEHIRICRPTGLSRQDAQKVVGYAIGKLGTDYAIRQIVDLARFLLPWSILPRRWRSSLFTFNPGASTKETCSSVIAEAFQSVDFPILPMLKRSEESGIELVQRIPRLCTPSDFDYSPFFEIIKYPILHLAEGPSYHRLPWKTGVLSDDEGRLYFSEEEKKLEVPVAVEGTKDESKPAPPVEFFD